MCDVLNIGCLGCWMFGMRNVRDVGCLECGLPGMWDVWDVGCLECAILGMCNFGIWVVKNVEYWGCRVFGM